MNLLDRLRAIALALPEVSERMSHGAPCFFIRGKRPLCYYHDGHVADGRISLWCPIPPGMQEALVRSQPERFFKPPMSTRGTFSSWLGVFLDNTGNNEVDWEEIADILEDAFRFVAPKTLVVELENRQTVLSSPVLAHLYTVVGRLDTGALDRD
ncbi:MAG: hypothetical protein JWO42_2009 [Chloroflexi bacterium]|jgi:hypothetical protein|nr:hypothetical protein [Chloroflexota bacterium]